MADFATADLPWLLLRLGVAAGVGAYLGGILGRRRRARSAAVQAARASEVEAARIRAEADADAQAIRREGEMAAREEALAARAAAEEDFRQGHVRVVERETEQTRRQVKVESALLDVAEGRAKLAEREGPIADLEGAAAADRKGAATALAAVRDMLERAAGETAAALRTALIEAEREDARAQAANTVRLAAESVSDPEHVRRARRIMGIAVGRFSGHYLTERHLSTIFVGPPRNGKPVIGEADLRAIEGVAGVGLSLVEGDSAVRIEGLDGVGREVARRCLTALMKHAGGSPEAVTRLAKEFAGNVEREVIGLGQRAFAVLEIERAHPDIVKLVGRLNYRTSYTQNQWKHAIEASLLCGMMADELGLDRKLALRAALMHDIGKSLTHELDGSHAVIGAEYARRLGEPEVVANAIGAHHTDEPFASPYAYLVAAADAMSGARPGARRQMEDNYAAKLDDLERISRGFRGVGEAFAVQGGREVRVYVREERVDDVAAVKLSSEIAETISREMTFPGQIRVTVIREFKAVETAN